jgi:xanthine dehydrogenase accessory factor
MNKQVAVWKLITDSAAKNIPVILLYVLESKGSSPGRQGFFMAVNQYKQMEGSIGGGIMEHKFVEMAKDWLVKGFDDVPEGQIRKQVHDKSAAKNQSGMICSGEQTVWIYPIQNKDLPAINKILASLSQNKNGTLELSPNGISFLEQEPGEDYYLRMESEDDWLYREKTGYKNHLYIIGGGHCALALSRLMRYMDFYIRVYDDREALNTFLDNKYAQEKVVPADYKELADIIPSGKNNYVVIMTFGYRTDDIALRALLDKDFHYMGLMGSSKKIEKMFNDLRAEGVAEERLQKIHAPIGIFIKSETPEEIAISIAAEIIAVKNKSKYEI